MEIHQPKIRLSNLMMLQDDLINQGGTPVQSSIFTQACYLLHLQPRRQMEYYQLGNYDCTTRQYTTLEFNLGQNKCTPSISQLIDMKGYTDFESLAILPARIAKTAGWDRSTFRPSIVNHSYEMPFTPATGTSMSQLSGNMQVSSAYFVPPELSPTLMRNLDTYTFHKYGDCVNIPVTTNIDGIHLLNDPRNDFSTLTNFDITDTLDANVVKRFYSEFYWPSYSRPFYSREDQLEGVQTEMRAKHFKPLNHSFLTMPPIRKANGALLKQRCSFIMEQSFSITFNISETIFGVDSEGINYDQWQLDQKDAVVLRPNFYGKLVPNVVPPVNGPFGENCPNACVSSSSLLAQPEILADTCYDNDMAGFKKFLIDTCSPGSNFKFNDVDYQGVLPKIDKNPFNFNWISMVPKAEVLDIEPDYIVDQIFIDKDWHSYEFTTKFVKAMLDNKNLYVKLSSLPDDVDFVPLAMITPPKMLYIDDASINKPPYVSANAYLDTDIGAAVIKFNINQLNELITSNVTCPITQAADPVYVSQNRDANIFFV